MRRDRCCTQTHAMQTLSEPGTYPTSRTAPSTFITPPRKRFLDLLSPCLSPRGMTMPELVPLLHANTDVLPLRKLSLLVVQVPSPAASVRLQATPAANPTTNNKAALLLSCSLCNILANDSLVDLD